MKTQKRLVALLLVLSLMISLIPAMAFTAYAVDEDYEEMFGVTYEQLYTLYPEYLSPDDEETIVTTLSSFYVDALEDQAKKNPVLQDILMLFEENGIASYSAEYVLELLGLNPSKEEDLLWDTTLLLLNNVYADELVVNTIIPVFQDMLDGSATVYNLFDQFQKEKFKKDMSELLDGARKAAKEHNLKIDIVSGDVFGELVDEVMKKTDLIQRIGDEGLELHDAIQSMFALWSIQRSSLMLLRKSVDSSSKLAKAIDLIFKEMEKNPCQFIIDHYAVDAVLRLIDDLLSIALDFVPHGIEVKQICLIMKTAGTFILSDFLNYASTKDINYTVTLMGYTNNLREAVLKWRSSAEEANDDQRPIGADDIANYEFVYAAYVAAIKTALESAEELVFDEQDITNLNRAIEICDKLTFSKYMMLCLRALRSDIDSGIVPVPTTDIGFPEWCIKSTHPASGTLVVTKDNANIMDRPCSVNTDMNARRIEQGALGAEYIVTASCTNIANNIWYQIITKSGEKGYIYSGNCDYRPSVDVTLTRVSMPSTLSVGSRYYLQGTISTQHSTILSVSCNVYDMNGNWKTGGTVDVNGKSYVLDYSAIDAATEFNILGVGTYRCEISAVVSSESTCENVVLYAENLTVYDPSAGSTTAPDAESASFVTRDDGIWLWPVPAERYALNDWAGCNGNNSCYWHKGDNHGGCLADHATWNGFGHNGVDIEAVSGQTPVYAAAPGTLYCTNTDWGYRGITAIVEHPIGIGSDGKEWSYYTIYQHLSSTQTNKDGKHVEAGTVIATTGQTDGFGTGQPHLHFAIMLAHSGKGYAMSRDTSIITSIEDCGWVTERGFTTGRILNNPALNSPAGTPRYNYGCEATCRSHAGSIMYTFDTAEVVIGENISYECVHDYIGVETPPTCDKMGYITYTCSWCGDSYIVKDDESWSEWSTSYPVGMSPNLIQTRTEYRYQEKEYTTSTSNTLPGWTLEGPTTIYGDYGEWSEWSDTPATESDIVKVETRIVWPYYYFLCSNCGAHMHGYGTCWTWAGGCGAPTYDWCWREVWSTTPWDSANLRDWYGTGKYYTYINGELVFQFSNVGPKNQYRHCTREAIDGYSFYRWGEWSDWSAAPCTSSDTRNAETRTAYRYYTGPLADHAWDDGVVTMEPTEESAGEITYTCTHCSLTLTESIPALEHEHHYDAIVTAPTCTERGCTTHTCRCGDSYVDSWVDALGHDMGHWFVVTEATCTSNGLQQRDCTRCDHSETQVIDATGHNHEAVVTNPTCTEQGFTTYTCPCGDSYVTDYTNPLGHSFTNYVSDGNATCTQDGTKTAVCDRCDATDTQIDVGSAHGHDFSEWTVVEEPTQTSDGLESRFCYNCGLEETRVISSLENPFADVPEGSFYHEPVLWAVANDITNGTTATTFGPEDQCMRAHVVTFLWRAAGSPEPESSHNPFVDVKESDFYYKAVLWAVEKGITNGLDATHFGPLTYCNRAQVVTFLWRAQGQPESAGSDMPFTDVAVGAWYEAPIRWAVANGITNGMSATSFGINVICNRAQIVTFLYRTYN